MNYYEDIEKAITEFESNGKRIRYDGCSSSSRKESDEFYIPKGFRFIGESNIMYINGVKNVCGKTHYFYKREINHANN